MARRAPALTFVAGLLLSSLAAGALVAGTAPPRDDPQGARRPASGKTCFFLSQVTGFSPAGRDQIRVETGPGETYLFRTLGACPDLDFGETLAFDQRGGGTVCNGIDVDLIVPSTIGPNTNDRRRCPVAMIRKLDPGETKARGR